MKQFFNDLVECGAIYYFLVAIVLVVASIYIDTILFAECRAHGFSMFYCLMK